MVKQDDLLDKSTFVLANLILSSGLQALSPSEVKSTNSPGLFVGVLKSVERAWLLELLNCLRSLR